MTTMEARNALVDVDLEEAYRFGRLMGFTHAIETPFQLFTRALDWAFEQGEQEIPLEEWDELRKIQEEHKRSSGPSHVAEGCGNVHRLDVNRTWEELKQLMCERSSGPIHVVVGGSAAQEADEWIRTSVWILEELADGHQGRWRWVV
jgi:hypothetical protein